MHLYHVFHSIWMHLPTRQSAFLYLLVCLSICLIVHDLSSPVLSVWNSKLPLFCLSLSSHVLSSPNFILSAIHKCGLRHMAPCFFRWHRWTWYWASLGLSFKPVHARPHAARWLWISSERCWERMDEIPSEEEDLQNCKRAAGTGVLTRSGTGQTSSWCLFCFSFILTTI